MPREQIWITTKLDNPWHKRVEEGLRTSCESLGVEYVDLYLMVSLRNRLRMAGRHGLTVGQALAQLDRPSGRDAQHALRRLGLR